ncbi:hypothetical protein [Streptomyces sp. NPDC005731]|uniref:hypothetical protein n=1 Tax=unclassified Streptomyces TaxID=2593676 RepID=UPI0033ED91E2
MPKDQSAVAVVGESVEGGELVPRGFQAVLESLDLAGPAVDAGLLDAVTEVAGDLFQTSPLLRVDAEHRTPDACIRCPMLHINPKMLGRLEELEADLLARLQRAEEENWLGEVEGIKVTSPSSAPSARKPNAERGAQPSTWASPNPETPRQPRRRLDEPHNPDSPLKTKRKELGGASPDENAPANLLRAPGGVLDVRKPADELVPEFLDRPYRNTAGNDFIKVLAQQGTFTHEPRHLAGLDPQVTVGQDREEPGAQRANPW